MDQSNIDRALAIIHEALAPLDISWMIIGTTSLHLLGYDINPQDIDIFTSTENALVVEETLKPYKLEFVNYPDQKFRSAFSKYLIDNVIVEIMGGLEVNTDSDWVPLANYIKNPIQVKLRERIFSVPGINDQKSIYKLFGRAKDERIISMLG